MATWLHDNELTDEEVAEELSAASLRSWSKQLVLLFVLLVVAWLLFDQGTKAYFNDYEVGQSIMPSVLGLFEFTLVHNTGAAWGVFGDSTFALGILSICVCLLLAGYYLATIRSSVKTSVTSALIKTLGVGLVVSGGIGNAIDRFTLGYVVDFIDLSFMDFPVFNIADIGVTCGVVLFLIAVILEYRATSKSISVSFEEEK